MLDFYKRVCASTYVPHMPIYIIDKLHYDDTNIKKGFIGGIILPDNSVFDMSLGYRDNFATDYLGPDTGVTDPTELFDMSLGYQDNFAIEYLGPDTGVTNPTELFDMSLGYQDNFATEFVDKRLLSYSPTFVYHTNGNDNVVVENKGTAGAANDLLPYSGRALQLGATNDLAIPTFGNGHLTYFDFATSEFVQVATDGTDHTFNSQTISNILVHHTPFTANDLTTLNAKPNLMAKLAMDSSSILELSMVLQGDEQWYPCTEESAAGVLSKVLNPVAGRTIFTTTNSSTDITFRAPSGEGLYVNGTYYDGQDATDVAVTAAGNTIELVESTDGVLTKIVAESQGLNGAVPDLSANQQLAIVNLSSNNLSGPVPDLSSNPQLTEVYFNNNNFTGPIPDLSANPQLTSVSFANNNLTGAVPDLSSNPQLTEVYFNNNNFTGPVPDLSANPQLKVIALDLNNLSGPVPDLSANPQLKVIALNLNNLSGPVPDLSANAQLTFVNLNKNNLSGPVPDLSANTQLTFVNLSNNNLSGPAPDLSANSQLIIVAISNTNLSGPVPNLSSNQKLASVYFQENNFTDFEGGTITVKNGFYAHENALTTSAVDSILQALVDGGTTGSVAITLRGGTNGVPTNTAAIDTLRSRGCTVTVNGGY